MVTWPCLPPRVRPSGCGSGPPRPEPRRKFAIDGVGTLVEPSSRWSALLARVRKVTVPPAAKRQVIGRMRSAMSELYMSVLLAKPGQGKVVGSTSRHGASNRFMRSGKYIRFADWCFLHRARLDVLPLYEARRWGSGARRCRRCEYGSETLPHFIRYCGPLSAACQLRHNAMREACRGLQSP